MAKFYLNRSEIVQRQVLDGELLGLAEQEIACREKQSTFRFLYDIEIAGVTIYYRKNWRYTGVSQSKNQSAIESTGIRTGGVVS